MRKKEEKKLGDNIKIFIIILLIIIYLIPHDDVRKPLINALSYIWFGFVFIALFFLYKYKGKEYDTKKQKAISKDIPLYRLPIELGYLVDKKIKTKHLTATIMNLIRKKVIDVRIFNNNFELTLIYENVEEITKSEMFLITWFFNRIGDGESVSYKLIEKDAKRNSKYFLNCFREWLEQAYLEVRKQPFFEKNFYIIEQALAYFSLSVMLIILNMIISNYSTSLYMLGLIIISLCYVSFISKRGKEFQGEYQDWLEFKNYLIKEKAFKKGENQFLEYSVVYTKILGGENIYHQKLINFFAVDKHIFEESLLLKLTVTGIMNDINKKIERCILVAKFKGSIWGSNKGSRAITRYKNQKDN